MMNDKKIEDKKKYVFFTDPDVVAKRAEAASASTLNNRFFSSNDNKPLTKTHECQLQPHPFTFITAVKRKLAIAAEHELNKQQQQHQQQQQQQQHIPDNISTLNIDKMDFIKPLKVPDMKISPKNMDYSPRLSQKSQKISLAHRKLDFSQSEGSSFITSDEIEQLKTPDVSFTSSINKKKDHTRDNNTKEKENRTKKLKNDDTSDNFKRRLIKHTSRKDYDDIQNKIKKNLSKDNDFNDYFGKKTKQKILATTTASSSSSSSPSSSPPPPSTTSVAAATLATTTSTTATAMTTTAAATTTTSTSTTTTSKKDDDRKLKSTSLHSIKSRDRSLESRSRSYSSESISDRNFKTRNNEQINHKYNDDFTKQRISSKKQFDTKKNDKSNFKNSKNNDDLNDSLDCRIKDIDKSQQTGSTNSIDDIFMDPRRISFRDDSYSTQDEFYNLTTPDMNLLYRPRKRKDTRIIQEQLQDDLQIGTNKKNIDDDKNINLRHPTALHMQFQAELHLFDSYNQSLQQVMDVENCLYNVQQEKSRELTDDKTNEFINQTNELIEPKKIAKEVQTQTANDIATQTDICIKKKQHPSITYSRGDLNQLSLGSIDEYDDFENIDKLKKMRTMSEISLHETTSSIKTETGTEISISTRDVTCSFNKYLDLEMVQLMKDEEQMYDKIELLFKSREKTLNDRTRKLVKLEEQKKALRDTGQDSRISSVKKKQRALLLKLQQEKDEMNRLKELHKLASQERKLMLQKQRNMFNPTMSTKNILTKLKRTADCQSPRRLSGPMKGYDIRSNSSISSLVDSDKSHIEKTKQSFNKNLQDSTNSSQIDSPKKFEVRKGKFEEKMPKVDSLKLRCHQFDIDDKINQTKQGDNFINNNNNNSINNNINNNNNGDCQEQKSESDTLVEDLTRKKMIDDNDDMTKKSKTTQIKLQNIPENNKQINKRKNSKSIKNKSSINVLSENILRQKTNILNNDDTIRSHKRTNNKIDKNDDENYKLSKNSILEELDMNESQNSIQTLVKHSKALKEKNCRLLKDISNDDEDVKENYLNDSKDITGEIDNDDDDDVQNLGNISTRSQVSTLTISRHSSGDSEKSYSRSVVIRSQDHRFKAPKKFEQEAKVVARQNCVEDWIAWHARLKARENRVARMEEATYKLFNASNPASYNDVTVSSDASEVAGRVELLSEELAEKKAVLVKLSKKQTKQKLKALEADLLNKIKKYDTTINEMQKKIETNRVVSKKSGKLAIEAKALADVKVPEIPIKRIQELYKNNDLLRSRSESDLLVNYTNPKTQTTDKTKKPSIRSIESILSERKNISQIKSSSNIDDESKNTKKYTDNTMTTTTKTKTRLTDELKNSKSLTNKIDYGHINNNESLDDPISTLKNDLKTLSEIMSNFSKKSDEKLRSVILTSVHEETPKSTSRDITDDLLKSSQTTSTIEPESIPEILTYNSNNKKSTDTTSSLILQNNIDNNDTNDVLSINLNKDNDTSSEITSVDVTEVISSIIPSQECTKISEEIDFTARSKAMLSEIEKSIILDKSLVNNGGKNLELSGAKLEKSMDDLHKENEALSSDFNIIEGDIQSISEIISKMSENNQSLSDYKCHQSNKQSLIENINSFIEDESNNHEIISEKDVNISHDSQDNLSVDKQSETMTSIDNNYDNDEVEIEEEIEEEIEASEINEAGNESSLESTKISHHENSSKIHENSKNESDWTISDSFEIQQDHSNIINNSNEQQIELNFDNNNKLIKNINNSFNYQNFDNDIDASYFVPNCESTNIGNTMLNDQETDLSIMIQQNTSQTDELDDILEIIENDCKKMELKNREKIITNIDNVPGELQLEIKNNIGVPVYSPELSLTTDVEPALKKLTEVLRSVERNIEKRTQSIETEKQGDIQDPVGSESTENDIEQITSKSTDTNNQCKNKKVSFSDKIILEIDFKDKTLVETNIDEKIEINRHLDEALDRLSVSEDNDCHHENLNDSNDTFITNDCNENDVIFKKPINKIQEILRDPEYEDISEESMEVSEILDRSISSSSHKSSKIPDKYEKIVRTDDVLRILDEISQKKDNNLSCIPQDLSKIPSLSYENNQTTIENIDETKSINDYIINETEKIDKIDDKSFENLRNIEDTTDDSSEEQETPREISEINMDSPRDQNSSRLDIETLDDDLLTPISPENTNNKLEYHTARPQTESEKDIENMIDKLRASLNTPGLDVAIIDARLLRIEELQIELQIKKLEAEEVSYYLREIPNKPPPPYTPPGGPKTSSRLKNLPSTVIPNNIDELTNFTEKATMFIYHEKKCGNDILMLDAPEEICETTTTNNNTSNTDDKIIDKNIKDDKKIYNTFLFDLCKETVADIYQSEYEKPGPSWTKPNYKTKTIIKLPKNIDELNEHVCKEVATLFGFKTKMQRENMVMRWSRKKGDRVDELLAREAQAEEDEWTKFHHDELAVKNELTIAIFNTLIMETTSVVKAAYAKKRKVIV
ncbi:hypothetical protein HCN44_006035 [Aphidius gifuensis]|uniref:DUF4378 domain-containing protein n=1 Tax=Aphidius gifuensis TaxID=684658 RepID=A0A834Y5A9_APHGI|nr:uncharacterized protein PF11_0213-like [Aphidius gifuensis]KAF7997464.1 hypothetical protein HCN44_006035 [Aphidius gifuensis]